MSVTPATSVLHTQGVASRKKTTKNAEQIFKSNQQHETRPPALSLGSKRMSSAAFPKTNNDLGELPHNMGRRPSVKKVKVENESDGRADEGERGQISNSKVEHQDDTKKKVNDAVITDESEEPPKKKAKVAQGDITPGITPYPDWPHPTAQECQVVHDLLIGAFPEEKRSRFIQPDTIPPPSEFVAGCGEVPTILDALLRTLLSAATAKRNSSNAFQGLVTRFGLQKSGPCKGSLDWNAVRLSTYDDVFAAIGTGGLGSNKSKNIKAILDMVYAENEERCKAHAKAIKNHDPSAAPKGADPENIAQMQGEIDLFKQGILTLDYYHLLPKDDALMAFQKYPGIGVKTAACVALFCMQRPCFAVDTHVFRLCKYLGWVPPDQGELAAGEKRRGKATEIKTFQHCEVRIPDHLKYGLHQLFWDHGNECPRCRAITGEKSAGWGDANCPIEHLVKRIGEKKGGVASLLKKAGKDTGGKNAQSDDMEDEDEEEKEDDNDDDDYSPRMVDKGTKAGSAANGKRARAKGGQVGKGKAKARQKGARVRRGVESEQEDELEDDAEMNGGD